MRSSICITMAESYRKPAQLIFDSDIGERWRLFEIEYEHYINIVYRNEPDAVKALILLNLAGPEALMRAQTFDFAPAVLDDNNQVVVPAETMRDPNVLLRKFRELCDPPFNRILKRGKFFARHQLPDEPVERFICDLKDMALQCHFGVMSNELIRDMLVIGMTDQNLKITLLQNADLTLEQAVHACRTSEIVATLSDQVDTQKKSINLTGFNKHPTTTANRRFMNEPPQTANRGFINEPPQRCPNCNYFHNKGRMFCPANGKPCNYCKKMNHFAVACRSLGNRPSSSASNLHLLQQD